MIIALNGKMGVGKSTAAALIAKVSDRPIRIVKFAAPLYDMQEFIYRRIAEVYTRPDTFIKDRTLLQWLGTEWGRGTISQTIWVDLWKAEAVALSNHGFTVVCDDVRFDNEAETVRALGGVVINIQTDRNENPATAVKGLTNHASENGVNSDLISRYIRNDGTETQFEANLLKLLKEEGLHVKKEFA